MSKRRWIALVVLIVGCRGRATEYRQYREAMCACADLECVAAVDVKFESTLDTPSTWSDRHLVSSGVQGEMRADLLAAKECAKKYLPPPGPMCGGESGEVCPPGYKCVMKHSEAYEAQGNCVQRQHDE